MTIAAPFVRVASYLNVAEAEVARMQLEMEDIPARLDNAALVSWFWHYSNVTGGVKVLVPAGEFARATSVILPPPGPSEPPPPNWACPRCHAEVDGRWGICWSCGCTAGGEEDPEFHDEGRPARAAVPESSDVPANLRSQYAAAIFVLSFLLVFVISHGSLLAVFILFVCFIFGGMFRWVWDRASRAAGAEQDAIEEPAPYYGEPTLAENDALAEVLVLRMWTTSIFGMLWSPLFSLWVLWLVFRLATLGVTLRPRDCFRYGSSLLFIVIGSLLFSWWAWATHSFLATIFASVFMVAKPPL
jgi:hypothetical protein